MHPHSTTFRAAKPTLEDGRVFARYLDEAAEGFFRLMLGRRSVDILAEMFTQSDHDLSYHNAIFAERNKVIVGMASGYTADQHRRSSDLPLKRIAGRFNLRMMVASIVFAPLLRVIDTMADDVFYLQAIAVDRELRGKGVGTALMDLIEERAAASGSARFSLDVFAKNESARRFYEQRGMSVESQWPKRLVIPGLKLFRMTKTL